MAGRTIRLGVTTNFSSQDKKVVFPATRCLKKTENFHDITGKSWDIQKSISMAG
jgi:hypothetical protein